MKMKMKMRMHFLFILIIIFMSSSIESSPVSEVYKVILSQNINDIGVKSLQVYNIYLIMNLKGLSIIFDNDSEISLMPMSLFEQISSFYKDTYSNTCFFQTKSKENGGLELTLDGDCPKLETVHYILKDRGISIPINELFKKNGDNAYYSFAFVGNDNVDRIIFGKNLIEKMEIELIGDNDYIIHNQDFVAKVDDN